MNKTQQQRGRENGIHYKHDLGQHFLYETALLRSLVSNAGVGKTDRVLEIGPGAGTLTVCLCEAAAREAGFDRVELVATLGGEPLYRACGYEDIERIVDARGGAPVPLIRMGKTIRPASA